MAKIIKSYKFSETIIRLIKELAKSPEFGGNATRLLETLVFREAQAQGLVKPSNHNQSHPHKK